jgi:predicted ATPase/DNA-binding SARP family transcriptional activator
MLRIFGEPRFASQPLPSERVTYLLALLACRDEWVSRDELVLLLWGDVDEAAGRQRLRQLLYRARSFPHAAGLESDATRVRLVETCDVRAFRVALRESRHSDAIQLYSGELMHGARFADAPELEEFFLVEREELAAAYRRAVLNHATTLEQPAALTVLEDALQIHPESEELALEGVRLARGVDVSRGEALFETHARALRALGLEPAPELLAARGALADAGKAASSTLRISVAAAQHKLPVPATAFIGRQRELAEVSARFQDARLVTVLGPGGAGKTRLSLEVAREREALHAHGAVFAGLAATQRTEDVPSALAGVLGVRPGDDPRETVLNTLSTKNMLLVLDNLEHLPGIAALVADILERAPDVRVLVTSREALGLRAEAILELEGLPAPDTLFALETQDAAQVFLHTAGRARADFKFGPRDAPAFTRIYTAVSGMPLGLELAAGWTRVMTLEEIADELEHSLDLLEVDASDVPERHRSFAAAFYSSWRLLSPTERAALARMSVFRGGFTRELAVSVAGCNLPTLLRLVNKSLVARREARFSLHEMIRQYAAKELPTGERDTALGALSAAIRAQCEEWYAGFKTDQQIELSRRLQLEVDNVRAALEWTLQNAPRLGAEIAGYLEHFWYTRGYHSEGLRWAQAFLATLAAQPRDDLRVRLLWVLVSLHKESGAYDDSKRALDEYAEIAAELGDEHALASSEKFNGLLMRERGDLDGSIAPMERALTTFRVLNDRNQIGICLNDIGIAHAYAGRLEDAKRFMEQSLEVKREIGDRQGVAYALGNLGNVAAMMGDLETDRILQQESLRIKRELGDAQGIANSLHSIAASLRDAGDLEGARAYHRESLEIFLRLGRAWGISQLLIDYSKLEVLSNRFDNALKLCAAGLAVLRRLRAEPRPSNVKTMDGIRAAQPYTDAQRLSFELEGERMTMEEAVTCALTHATDEQADPISSARAASNA